MVGDIKKLGLYGVNIGQPLKNLKQKMNSIRLWHGIGAWDLLSDYFLFFPPSHPVLLSYVFLNIFFRFLQFMFTLL